MCNLSLGTENNLTFIKKKPALAQIRLPVSLFMHLRKLYHSINFYRASKRTYINLKVGVIYEFFVFRPSITAHIRCFFYIQKALIQILTQLMSARSQLLIGRDACHDNLTFFSTIHFIECIHVFDTAL